MSVMISVIGSKPESDEYQGALKLKKIIQEGLPTTAIGEIILHANATLIGQAVKDVDLLMMGTIRNYAPKLKFSSQDKEIVDEVEISSFCTVIEIKSHDISGIYREGTEIFVRYGAGSHSVTTQSNEQKISAKRFFEKSLSYSPFITNVIWFVGASRDEIKQLLTIGNKTMPSNALGAEFELKELMQLLVMQRIPRKHHGHYSFDSGYGGRSVDDLQKMFGLFTKAKDGMGELTRKRIEQISSRNIEQSLAISNDTQMSIMRGRAGTGKTIGLMQTSIKLVDEEDARVLILTYNRALVSDIRRLFALAELPDMFQEQCVSINTMQSFFYRIINYALCNGNLSGKEYLEKYEVYLQELLEFLREDGALEYISELCSRDSRLDWDYCLVDEAQDWTVLERDLILKLFNSNQLIVADGGNQFVRKVCPCDWNIVKNRKNVKLKYCLRQKNNIISFNNHFTRGLGDSMIKITGSEKMIGGKIIIVSEETKFYDVYQSEFQRVKEAGNIPYDVLMLIPYQMVECEEDRRYFKKKSEFEKNGIFVWDGTDEDNRNSYSIIGDEVRLYQYESARGLEAWLVCCFEFDVFLDNKLEEYDSTQEGNALILESEEEKLRKYILNWALIPLTRAIDTIIITLKNKDSKWATYLEGVQKECGDYVLWI